MIILKVFWRRWEVGLGTDVWYLYKPGETRYSSSTDTRGILGYI